jgi:hypothetical protein
MGAQAMPLNAPPKNPDATASPELNSRTWGQSTKFD